MRKVKIVCTIGPASREENTLYKLALAGMNVARLNFSHGTHEAHAEVIERIRAISSRIGREITILQDLSGPKIRLGELVHPKILKVGEVVTITTEEVVGEGDILPVRYSHFAMELKAGDQFSMNDGLVRMEAIESDGIRVRARVLSDGTVSTHKGVNLPTGGNGVPSLTEKDEADLRFGLEAGVDWVSLSFVRSPDDCLRPREIMREMGRVVPLMAKIEKRQALERIDEVIRVFDGFMVARGDLGVEIPLEDLPAAQKSIIRKANEAAKPVVTATQMLLSMVGNPRPTRAEVMDVANAILDGTDAVMLSEETAMGGFSIEAVRMMATIGEKAQGMESAHWARRRRPTHADTTEAIAQATRTVAEEVNAAAIATSTASGATARMASAMRPKVPILALSADLSTVRSLGIHWGITAGLIPKGDSTDEIFDHCKKALLDIGLAKTGDLVVVTAGAAGESGGGTNLLRVITL